ncbi:MAG: hypothetical protein LKI25_05495 [Atopobiaceae bacterium]|jgi:hypothetical protein|nr:hypothetical protein [Atopobiaceae bacterium]MCI2173654.1 hypothetical protein [Atopobiaceae bacterium]MCI2207704.1 hypothetical protein [Atopobiaceae bacterium]
MGDERDGVSLSSLLQTGLSSVTTPELGIQQKARLAWSRANGDLERRHTCGVFLKEGGSHTGLPTLIVYIDSSSLIQDFTCDRQLYVERLCHEGLPVVDVQFKLSRRKRTVKKEIPPKHEVADLPPLDVSEQRRVTEMCGKLPDALRDKAMQAMSSSLRWEKLKGTKED